MEVVIDLQNYYKIDMVIRYEIYSVFFFYIFIFVA